MLPAPETLSEPIVMASDLRYSTTFADGVTVSFQRASVQEGFRCMCFEERKHGGHLFHNKQVFRRHAKVTSYNGPSVAPSPVPSAAPSAAPTVALSISSPLALPASLFSSVQCAHTNVFPTHPTEY
ncbi:hypothetical protein PM082_004109 [Marasmius tenuissimus]|nr:hypothetical protein PM082_004109 [Marasmius tenuissimus]